MLQHQPQHSKVETTGLQTVQRVFRFSSSFDFSYRWNRYDSVPLGLFSCPFSLSLSPCTLYHHDQLHLCLTLIPPVHQPPFLTTPSSCTPLADSQVNFCWSLFGSGPFWFGPCLILDFASCSVGTCVNPGPCPWLYPLSFFSGFTRRLLLPRTF